PELAETGQRRVKRLRNKLDDLVDRHRGHDGQRRDPEQARERDALAIIGGGGRGGGGNGSFGDHGASWDVAVVATVRPLPWTKIGTSLCTQPPGPAGYTAGDERDRVLTSPARALGARRRGA